MKDRNPLFTLKPLNWSKNSKGDKKVQNQLLTKEDKRVIRSKRDLSNALDELLNEKNFDDISVQDITNKALVSKNTFYNNFLDKNELLMYLFTKYSLEIFEQIEPLLNSDASFEIISKEALKCILNYFTENYFKFKKMIENDRSKALYWNFYKFIQGIVAYIFDNYHEKLPLGMPLEIASPFLAGGISNLIYSMMLSNKTYSKDEIYNYLIKLSKIDFQKVQTN